MNKSDLMARPLQWPSKLYMPKQAIQKQKVSKIKKLALFLATSKPLTEASKENEVILAKISCIHYQHRFQKDTIKMQALINFDSKANAMMQAYKLKLGLQVCYTNIKA